MSYKDFEACDIFLDGVLAVKIILTAEIQRKLKTSARKKKWQPTSLLHNDTFTMSLHDGCTVNVNFREPLRLK